MMRALVVLVALALWLPAAGPTQTSKPVQRGEELYGRFCITCHGPAGAGIQAPSRGSDERVGVGPPLRAVGALAADFYLRTGYMPLRDPYEQPKRTRTPFAADELDALVAYVASLGGGPPVPQPHPERGSPSEGLRLFTEHCAGCHQVVAEGGVVTGARVPPLEDATPVEIAEAVRIGPYVMPRFSQTQLGAPELDSIIRYIQYAKDPADEGGWAIGHIGPIPEGMVTWLLAATLLVGVCVVIGKRVR
jgi:ubiquinol-cytochrome c reductase cytochrome c subunit